MIRKILLIFVLFTSISNINAKITLIDRIVAVINDDIKTLSDLNAFKKIFMTRKNKLSSTEYNDAIKSDKNLLNVLIQETLIKQYIKENNYESTEEEIKGFIQRRMRQLGMSQKDFESQLKIQGQTLEQFKDEFKMERAKARLFEMDLKRKIAVSKRDIEEYFKSKNKEDVHIVEYKIDHILCSSLEKAEKVKKDLLSGKDFKEMAFKYSEDKATKNYSGNLGFLQIEDLLPELAKVAKNMSPGDIKGPVKTKLGYHIIKLVQIRSKENPAYAQAKENIEQILVGREFNKQLELWTEGRKDESYVKIFL